MPELFEVLYEDAELLAINKPAGLVCHPTKGDAYSSLISRVRLHVGTDLPVHLVNRLDRETSGVVLVVKGDKRVGKIKQLFAEREVTKEYLAIVHGHVAADGGSCAEPLGRDEQAITSIKDCVRPDGSPAQTDFTVIKRFERAIPDSLSARGAGEEGGGEVGGRSSSITVAPVSVLPSLEGQGVGSSGIIPHAARCYQPSTINHQPFTMLRVHPHTGRKHQIRIHLAYLGHPVVGDKIYGGDERLYLDFVERRLTEEQRCRLILPCQALHAELLRFNWLLKEWEFRAEPEPWFRDFIEGKPYTPDWQEKYL